MPSNSSFALDKAIQLDWDNLCHGQQTHSNKLLSEEILSSALAIWQDGREETQLDWNNPSEFSYPILRWIQGSRYALFNSAPVPESAEEIISTLHRLAFPNQKSVTRQPFHEIIRVLLERKNELHSESAQESKFSSLAFRRWAEPSALLPRMWAGAQKQQPSIGCEMAWPLLQCTTDLQV